MSKVPVFSTLESSTETFPLSSPASSPQIDKTFDFSKSPSEKARKEAEDEIRKQKEEKLNEYLTKLESATVINGDYLDDLQGSIDIIKNTSVNVELINRFANLAAKLQNTGMIIKEFYDSIFSLNKDSLNPSLTKIIESLPVISIKSPNAKAYFFELLSNPQNIAKLDLNTCSQITNILPDIGNNELARQIDTNLKEHLKNKLDREVLEVLQYENLDSFMMSFLSFSEQNENYNLINTTDQDNIRLLLPKFIKDSSSPKVLEEVRLIEQLVLLRNFLNSNALHSILNLDKDSAFLTSLHIDKNGK